MQLFSTDLKQKLTEQTLTVFFLLLITIVPAYAVDNTYYKWTNTLGDSLGEQMFGYDTDSDGNYYITGRYYSNPIDFNPKEGTDSHANEGLRDAFVSKWDSQGNHVWTKTFGGTGEEIGYSVRVMPSGDVVVAGQFYSSFTFPSSPPTLVTTVGGADHFIAKFSADGDYLWIKTIGSTANDYYSTPRVSVDSSNNIYMTGQFSSTTDLNPGSASYTKTAVGEWDVFFVKLDKDGNFVYAKTFGSSSYDYITGIDVENNTLCIVGAYRGTSINLNPDGSAVVNITGAQDSYVILYNTEGAYQWSRTISTTTPTSTSAPYACSIDSEGNVIVTSFFKGTNLSIFETNNFIYNPINNDIAITKLTSTGSLVWNKIMTGPGGDIPYGVSVDEQDNLYISGNYDTSGFDADPSPTAQYLLSNAGLNDTFVAKLSENGDFIWAKNVGDSTGNGVLTGAPATVVYNSVVLAGNFQNPTDFNPFPDATDTRTSNGSDDIFFTVIGQDFDAPVNSNVVLADYPEDNLKKLVTGTATDEHTTVATVYYQVGSTTGTWNACTADDGTFDEISEDYTCTVLLNGIGDGANNIYIKTEDAFENSTATNLYEELNFTKDATGPKNTKIGLVKTEMNSVGKKTLATKENRVKLYFNAKDSINNVSKIMVSEHKDFRNSTWKTYDGDVWINLSDGDEKKRVYFKFQDDKGNTSDIYEQLIKVDTTPPLLDITKIGTFVPDFEKYKNFIYTEENPSITLTTEKDTMIILYVDGQEDIKISKLDENTNTSGVFNTTCTQKDGPDECTTTLQPTKLTWGNHEVTLLTEDSAGHQTKREFSINIGAK
jgi:hypothetical protein